MGTRAIHVFLLLFVSSWIILDSNAISLNEPLIAVKKSAEATNFDSFIDYFGKKLFEKTSSHLLEDQKDHIKEFFKKQIVDKKIDPVVDEDIIQKITTELLSFLCAYCQQHDPSCISTYCFT